MQRGMSIAAGILVLSVALVATFAVGSEGTVYGQGVGKAEFVKLSDLVAAPAEYVGKTLRVEGLVTDVCPKRGCWMDLAGDGATVRVKVDDGVIVFPLDAKGKQAMAEGVFSKIEQTREQALAYAQHMAEERGEKFDPEKHKDIPTVIYQLKGTGAVIE